MLTDRLEGRFLAMLAALAGARRVLEIGTFTGYSALSLAEGVGPGGRVVTCEVSPEHAEVARRNIAASPLADRIEVRLGPALETLASLEGSFDLVFIDADKPSYPDYYEAALRLLAPGGVIVLDNTLRAGRVLAPDPDDHGTRAVAALNDRIVRDERVTAVLLPLRDGVTLVRRRTSQS